MAILAAILTFGGRRPRWLATIPALLLVVGLVAFLNRSPLQPIQQPAPPLDAHGAQLLGYRAEQNDGYCIYIRPGTYQTRRPKFFRSTGICWTWPARPSPKSRPGHTSNAAGQQLAPGYPAGRCLPDGSAGRASCREYHLAVRAGATSEELHAPPVQVEKDRSRSACCRV